MLVKISCSGAFITFSLYEDNKGPEVTCCMGGKVYYEFSLPEGLIILEFIGKSGRMR
jgi:hypothetical protein